MFINHATKSAQESVNRENRYPIKITWSNHFQETGCRENTICISCERETVKININKLRIDIPIVFILLYDDETFSLIHDGKTLFRNTPNYLCSLVHAFKSSRRLRLLNRGNLIWNLVLYSKTILKLKIIVF